MSNNNKFLVFTENKGYGDSYVFINPIFVIGIFKGTKDTYNVKLVNGEIIETTNDIEYMSQMLTNKGLISEDEVIEDLE